jgi:diaminopimelate epimerase
MGLRFSKMHGAGNDFVVIDALRQSFEPTPDLCRWLADRRFGIGCAQILIVQAPTRPDADFRYRIFNADGGEVEQCGNGARCFARFVHDQGLTDSTTLCVETLSGLITPSLEVDGRVRVDMGAPRLQATEIPFDAIGLSARSQGEAQLWELPLGDGRLREMVVVSMGNPHAVQCVVDVDQAPVALEGAEIEHHPRFPQRVNAGFLQVVDSHHAKLRVWERGAGETLACGTGACAAAVAGIQRGLLQSPVEIATLGGVLRIEWDGTATGSATPVYLTGPAQTVFSGEITLPALDNFPVETNPPSAKVPRIR